MKCLRKNKQTAEIDNCLGLVFTIKQKVRKSEHNNWIRQSGVRGNYVRDIGGRRGALSYEWLIDQSQTTTTTTTTLQWVRCYMLLI